jgi:uncharacterized protein with PQ loop repeat
MDQILGWTATSIFSLMLVPQIMKTLKTRDVSGVSPWLFIMNFVANIIALCYATLISQPPLQIKYVLALIATGTYLVIYYKVSHSNA